MHNKDFRRNNIIIGVLLCIVAIMAVGFAAFNSKLDIKGTANSATNWCVGFDSIKTSDYTTVTGKTGGTAPTGTMAYDGTACGGSYKPTANLSTNLKQPGDKVVYTLTIKNASTLAAAIKSIKVENENVTSNKTITKGNIKYIVEMPESTTLASDAETTMKVTAMFQNDTDIEKFTGTETQTISVEINAQQDDGTGGFTPTSAEQKVYAINTNTITKDVSTLQDIGTTYNSCSATGKNVCLKYTIENNKVTGADVCFMKGENESCLKGWVDECQYDENTDDCTFTGTQTVFNSNKSVLQGAFTEENACRAIVGHFNCNVFGWTAGATDEGEADATGGSWGCNVYANVGNAYCIEDGGI